MDTEEKVSTPTIDDDFANAFADFIKEEDGKEPVVVGPATAKADAATEVTIAPAVEETEQDKAAREAAEAAKLAAAVDEPKPNQDAEFLERLKQTIKEAVPAPVTPVAEVKPTPAAPEPAYNEREQAAVDEYMKNYGDVYQAEQLIRRQEYKELASYIFAQIAPAIQAIHVQTTQNAQRTHVEDVQTAIPDFKENAPKVIEWVEKQPDYLKPAYQAVVARGSAAQVVDLFDRWRKETGATAPVTPAAPDPAIAAKAAEDAKLAKAAAALAPVAAKRGGVATSNLVDPGDYDGAFAAFAKLI